MTPVPGENPDLKKPEAAPVAPVAPGAAPESAERKEVKVAGAAEHGKETAVPAKDLVKPGDKEKPAEQKADEDKDKPFDNPEGLPENEMTRLYYQQKEIMSKNDAKNGPIASFTLAALRLAAIYYKYLDLLPGRYEEKIVNDDESKSKKLTKEQLAQVLKPEPKGKSEDEVGKALAAKIKVETEKKHIFGGERASTKFATNVLWGNDDFNDFSTLAASLLHTSKGSGDNTVSLYKQIEADELDKKDVKKGTLMVFIPDIKTADKVVAYATGNKDEFKYYDVNGQGDHITTFRANDKESPTKKLDQRVLMILEPNLKAYQEAKDDSVDSTTEKTELTPEQITDKALAAIDTGNKDISTRIEEQKKTPNPDKLKDLKAAAQGLFDEADARYKEMKTRAESDDCNTVKLKAEVESSNAKVLATTPAKQEDIDAHTAAVEKLDEATKFQENFAKMKELRDKAEANNTAINGGVPPKPTETPAPAPATTVPPKPTEAPAPAPTAPVVTPAPAPAQAPASVPLHPNQNVEGQKPIEGKPENALDVIITKIENDNSEINKKLFALSFRGEAGFVDIADETIRQSEIQKLKTDSMKNYQLVKDTYSAQMQVKTEDKGPNAEKQKDYQIKLGQLYFKTEELNNSVQSLQ